MGVVLEAWGLGHRVDAYEDVTDQAPCFPFYFRMLRSGPHENFHYVVGDPETREAALVDPAFHVDRIVDTLERDGYRLHQVWLTHGHWDHIGGVPDALRRGAERVFVHRAAQGHEKLESAPASWLDDGERFRLGDLDVEALHTPGHQPENTSFLVHGERPALFTGDTLFIRSCGRTDFPGGDTDAMFASMQRLRRLPGDVHVLPGHDYADAVSEPLATQCAANPALTTTDRAAFEALPFLRG